MGVPSFDEYTLVNVANIVVLRRIVYSLYWWCYCHYFFRLFLVPLLLLSLQLAFMHGARKAIWVVRLLVCCCVTNSSQHLINDHSHMM